MDRMGSCQDIGWRPERNAQGPNEDRGLLSSMRISAVLRAREREGKAGMLSLKEDEISK
jgi:hypothetical protein